MISAEDFDYVIGDNVDEEHPHGDLDRIIIDGRTMLKRDEDYASVRGEDIAVLAESYAARHAYLDTGIIERSSKFRLVPSLALVNRLIDSHNRLMVDYSYLMVHPAASIPAGQAVHNIQTYIEKSFVSKVFPSVFWSYGGYSKFPIANQTSNALESSPILDLFMGVNRFFRAGVTSYIKNYTSYITEEPLSFSDSVHGMEPHHETFIDSGYISGYDCVGTKADNEWKWYSTTFSGGGKCTVNVLHKIVDDFPKNAKHIKRVWPVYVVELNYARSDGVGYYGRSCVVAKNPAVPSSDGVVQIDIGADVQSDRFWSAYGRPERLPPASAPPETAYFSCSDTIKVSAIYFFFEFDDDIC